MLSGELVVPNHLGLHARAAAQLVRVAGRFESEIRLDRKDKNIFANAKSILSVLTLAASKGTSLTLTVEGKDESEAFQQISDLFNNGFGES